MKPSAGRVPQWPIDVLESSTVGPLARSMSDIALTMNIITKPDVRDSTSLPYDHARYNSAIDCSLHGKKIACVDLMKDAKILDYLISQGVQVDFISLDIELAINIYNALLEPKMLQQCTDIPQEKRHLAHRAVQRKAVLAHRQEQTYSQLHKRHQIMAHMRKFMQSYDFILGPATVIKSDQQSALTEYVSPMSIFFCLTKQPTVTIPIGLDSNGMPQSVMIAGSMHDDLGILQSAHAIEKQFPMLPCPVIL